MSTLEIILIDIVVFYITYKLWLRAENFEHIEEEISKAEAVFVALVDTAAVTICMII